MRNIYILKLPYKTRTWQQAEELVVGQIHKNLKTNYIIVNKIKIYVYYMSKAFNHA